MSERWVNARIEILYPLDTVTVAASDVAKIAEATQIYDDLIADLPERWHQYVTVTSFEDAGGSDV